jgi:phosphatidylserine/phosphatidylglycerophosphate/cardiolipin synthase-like enzyme
VRIDSRHAIQHNKYIVIDGTSVETGSFNYSAAAAHSNAENALVIWNNPALAAQYTQNWELHWGHAEAWKSTY